MVPFLKDVFLVFKKILKCGFKICTRENMDSQANAVSFSLSEKEWLLLDSVMEDGEKSNYSQPWAIIETLPFCSPV